MITMVLSALDHDLVKRYLAACPDVSLAQATDFLTRLNPRYFRLFDFETQCLHLQQLYRLSTTDAFWVDVARDGHRVVCTVLAFDYPNLFSVLTGVLSSLDMNIESGDVFSYAEQSTQLPLRKNSRHRLGISVQSPLQYRRRIVDQFVGVLDTDMSLNRWKVLLKRRLRQVFGYLGEGSEGMAEKALGLVYEWVSQGLHRLTHERKPVLYPVDVTVRKRSSGVLRLVLKAQDTPFFLATVSMAISLNHLSIERVHIRTKSDGFVEDEFELRSTSAMFHYSRKAINTLKLSVILTKQMSYFLDYSADALHMMRRFRVILEDVISQRHRQAGLDFLTDPQALYRLAQLLGASDYLWEDFIRVQYQSLLPMIRHARLPIFPDRSEWVAQLRVLLQSMNTFAEKKTSFNGFKNEWLFRCDLAQILNQIDFIAFSKHLTDLADALVIVAMDVVMAELCHHHGVVSDEQSRECAEFMSMMPIAVFGLGKLGGAALGYASDIELVFVYADFPDFLEKKLGSAAVFFEQFVQLFSGFIVSKSAGIFQLDLRLRPYGSDGPMAVNRQVFESYYSPDGAAQFYERLALTRLRYIAGDRVLANAVSDFRDRLLYASDVMDEAALWAVRSKQFAFHVSSQQFNAKYSPGALVDVEYTVQVLQLRYGRQYDILRTTSIHDVLDRFVACGVMDIVQIDRLKAAYFFFRQLINALRMLRGSARDVFLPPTDSLEFIHLARRLNVMPPSDWNPGVYLWLLVRMHCAVVRQFVLTYFPSRRDDMVAYLTIADMMWMDSVSESVRDKLLRDVGFKQPEIAYRNLRQLKACSGSLSQFVSVAVMACDWLKGKSDPDRALNNWERYVTELSDPDAHFSKLAAHPQYIGIVMDIFSCSQFLSDSVIREPWFLDHVLDMGQLRSRRRRGNHYAVFIRYFWHSYRQDWRRAFRQYRRWELLRIAVRDVSLQVSLGHLTEELSALAEVILQWTLNRVWHQVRRDKKLPLRVVRVLRESMVIMAMGKLGASELNYSSDIDLMVVANSSGWTADIRSFFPESVLRAVVTALMREMTAYLSEGQIYRVDFRLRPFGRSGELVTSLDSVLVYYEREASAWEIQALLKLRPVAGNWGLGFELMNRLQPILKGYSERFSIWQMIASMREQSVRQLKRSVFDGVDVKLSEGGIRDIEFYVQGLQLQYGRSDDAILRVRGTLPALDMLWRKTVLKRSVYQELVNYYLFMRRVEHFLQLLDDRQTHLVPNQEVELTVLARKMMGSESTVDGFRSYLDTVMQRVRELVASGSG